MLYSGDWNHCWLEGGPDTESRLAQALSVWAPEHTLVAVLLNNPGFGGCGGGGRISMPLGVTWDLVAHELGHGLGGLGDEYCGAQSYSGGEPGAVNLTVDTNRNTLKWRHLVASTTPLPTGDCTNYTAGPRPATWDDTRSVGLFEGATIGQNGYNQGLYRPVLNCRMNSNQPEYCPVCRPAMDAVVTPHLPTALRAGQAGREETMHDGYVRMIVRYEAGRLGIRDAREVAGPLVLPQVVATGLAHEVRLGGRRIALGSMPDINVSRSLNDPAHGPREHHTYRLDAFDFVVRVPRAALRGADLADLTVSLVSVQSSRYEPVGDLPLAEEPTMQATELAMLRPDSPAELPEALRRARQTDS